MNLSELSVEQLRKAAQLKEQIETLTRQLNALLGGATTVTTKPAAGGTMSPTMRAHLSALAKARWAKVKAGKGRTLAAVKKVPAKKTMSPEARAKIAAALKARWAKIKAAKGK